MRKRLSGILVLAVSLAGLQLVSTTPARAQAHNCGGAGFFFDGYTLRQTGVEGASAYIYGKQAAVCDVGDTGPGNLAAAWSMVAGAGGRSGWAQAGYRRSYGTGIQHYAEDSPTGGGSRIRLGSFFPYGERHHYWVDYDPIGGCFVQYVDVTAFQCTNFFPYGTWPQPFEAQFYGETHHLESDVPGNNTVGWAGFNFVQRKFNGGWGDPVEGAIGHSDAWFYRTDLIAPQAGRGYVFDIWTDPVAR